MDDTTLSLDDSIAFPVRRPASAAELGDLVREAAAAGLGVYPAGGRTALHIGLPPLKPGVTVDTRGLNRVVDYPARDMTVTVGAGVTLAELAKTLAAENQWLPIDVPDPDRATVGGALAVNSSGPRRLGYGTLRDYVIGIAFVADDGGVVRAGGRVVKNVAGYDLMKLHIGALGTLGVVTEVTLKVKPKPEAAAVTAFECAADRLGAALDALHGSKTRPAAVEAASGSGAWRVAVAFEEKAITVDWQLATLRAELTAAGADGVRVERDAIDAHLAGRPGDATLSWKANVRPSRTAAFCNAAVAAHPGTRVHAHALNGIVHGHIADDSLTLGAAAAMLRSLTALAADGGGNVVVRRCPPAWKAKLPVWGRPSADRALMRHVKATLDPKNLFNPGRLFGDL